MSTTMGTTINNLGVAMFSVADVDAAIAFYTGELGWELRSDVRFGEDGSQRWVEVAPPGSTARLALNPPVDGDEPGGGSIGVETPDAQTEHDRLAEAGVEVGDIMAFPGAPTMFSAKDPDSNWIWVVEVPA